jgi:hypothetical protein
MNNNGYLWYFEWRWNWWRGRGAVKRRTGGKEDAGYVKESGISATRMSHAEE